MRENKKERELLKASRPKTLLMIQKSPSYSVAWGLYTAQSQGKLQKSMNLPLLLEEQFRKNENCSIKVKKAKQCRNKFVGCELNSR